MKSWRRHGRDNKAGLRFQDHVFGGFQKVMCFVIFLFRIIADTQIITGMKRTVALAHQVFITLDSGRIILIQTICQCILTVDSDIGGISLPIFLRGFNCFVEIRTGYVQCGELGGGKIVVGVFLLYIIVAPRGGRSSPIPSKLWACRCKAMAELSFSVIRLLSPKAS